MATYDPKKKRAHSPTAPEGPAPVDDLLGPPPTPVDDPDASPVTTGPEPVVAEVAPPVLTPAPVPRGPDARVIGLAVGAGLAILWFWRRRRA